MMNFRLNNATLQSIHASTGMDAAVISESDVNMVDRHIEKQIGKKLTPAISFAGLTPRGSVYLMFKRFFTGHEIDSKLDSIE